MQVVNNIFGDFGVFFKSLDASLKNSSMCLDSLSLFKCKISLLIYADKNSSFINLNAKTLKVLKNVSKSIGYVGKTTALSMLCVMVSFYKLITCNFTNNKEELENFKWHGIKKLNTFLSDLSGVLRFFSKEIGLGFLSKLKYLFLSSYSWMIAMFYSISDCVDICLKEKVCCEAKSCGCSEAMKKKMRVLKFLKAFFNGIKFFIVLWDSHIAFGIFFVPELFDLIVKLLNKVCCVILHVLKGKDYDVKGRGSSVPSTGAASPLEECASRVDLLDCE